MAHAMEATVWRLPLLGFLPNPDPDLGRKLVLKGWGRTDAGGEWWAGQRSVRVGWRESLTTELVFLNLQADLTHEAVGRVGEAVRAKCEGDARLCGLGADEIDVLEYFVAGPDDHLLEVLWNPDPAHRGAALLSVAHGQPPVEVTGERRSAFRVKWNYGSLQRGFDDVRVELERVSSASNGARSR